MLKYLILSLSFILVASENQSDKTSSSALLADMVGYYDQDFENTEIDATQRLREIVDKFMLFQRSLNQERLSDQIGTHKYMSELLNAHDYVVRATAKMEGLNRALELHNNYARLVEGSDLEIELLMDEHALYQEFKSQNAERVPTKIATQERIDVLEKVVNHPEFMKSPDAFEVAFQGHQLWVLARLYEKANMPTDAIAKYQDYFEKNLAKGQFMRGGLVSELKRYRNLAEENNLVHKFEELSAPLESADSVIANDYPGYPETDQQALEDYRAFNATIIDANLRSLEQP